MSLGQGQKNFINDLQRKSKLRHQGIDFTKMSKFMKPKDKPVKEMPVHEDPPKEPIKRPPTVYDNRTPYEIASELHNQKD